MAADFADAADFITVYTSEGHASDDWAAKGNKIHIKQHTCLEDRILSARVLLEDDENYPGTLYIDKMENAALTEYGAWPDRLYVVLDGVVVFEGLIGAANPDPVRRWLKRFTRKHN